MSGVVILDLKSTQIGPDEKEMLRHPYTGGVILFSRNYEDPGQLIELTKEIRAIRPELLICVDHEGGRVQRFKNRFTQIPAMARLGEHYLANPEANAQTVVDCAWLMATELQLLGVDISFAPVIDTDSDFSEIIGDRAFSGDYQQVTEIAKLFIQGMNEAGMAATVKHFPGHGGVRADSHLELPIDTRSLEALKKTDLIPFVELLPIAAGVMPAHILFNHVDDEPVGFSSYWLKDVLRGNLDYKGVIFSDDLSMEGASIAGDHRQRAIAALSAGCDVVIVCNDPGKASNVLDELSSKNWPIIDTLSQLRSQHSADIQAFDQLENNLRWQQSKQFLEKIQ